MKFHISLHNVKIYDLLHSTGQDFTAAQRERAQEDFKVLFKGAPPHPPSHSHTKDSHSTGITAIDAIDVDDEIARSRV